MKLASARQILTEKGWLSVQEEGLRARILQRGVLIHLKPGDTLYRVGDAPGGIYGLAQGAVSASISPFGGAPRPAHVWRQGHWMGEGCFLSRGPRRVGVQALVESWALHVPLEALDLIERDDPTIVRRVSQILLINLDMLIRSWHEHQLPDHEGRIAASLCRLFSPETSKIPLSQTDLGALARASRKQVNATLRRFEAEGWVTTGYRSITIKAVGPLQELAERQAEET